MCNTTKQKNNLDYHAWNINKKGDINDQLNKEVIDMISFITFGHMDYNLIYKEWIDLSPFYEEYKIKFNNSYENISKNDKVKLLKQNIPFKCLHYAIIKKSLFNYEIKLGSLGLECNKTKKIHWEYGNGKDHSDY